MFKDIVLEITGGLGTDTDDDVEASALVSGTTVASGIPGNLVKFSLNLENTYTSGLETFDIEVEGYSNWAESVTVEPAELTIPAGTDVPFYVYITPKAGANAVNTASVAIYAGDVKVASKLLTVNVAGTADSDIQVTDLGNQITGAFAGTSLDLSTALVISSIIAGIVILGAVYMFTLAGKR